MLGLPDVAHEDDGRCFCAGDFEKHGGLGAVGVLFGWGDVFEFGPGAFEGFGGGVDVGVGVPAGEMGADGVVEAVCSEPRRRLPCAFG